MLKAANAVIDLLRLKSASALKPTRHTQFAQPVSDDCNRRRYGTDLYLVPFSETSAGTRPPYGHSVRKRGRGREFLSSPLPYPSFFL